jgi:hypothetical protein
MSATFPCDRGHVLILRMGLLDPADALRPARGAGVAPRKHQHQATTAEMTLPLMSVSR